MKGQNIYPMLSNGAQAAQTACKISYWGRVGEFQNQGGTKRRVPEEIFEDPGLGAEIPTTSLEGGVSQRRATNYYHALDTTSFSLGWQMREEHPLNSMSRMVRLLHTLRAIVNQLINQHASLVAISKEGY